MSDTFFEPGSDEYEQATQPHNSSGSQRPAAVARPVSPDEVVAVIAEAGRRGLRVMPQATGHGAGGDVGDDVVILDTRGFDSLDIDLDSRVATAGAGLTWSTVNGTAENHGLLGLAGSAPTVCISGYTFGGGVGWLARPYGMASSALRAVGYVTGDGRIRRAADDAEEQVDREALFAFRGGGGVGIATSLEFDLFPAPDLHAGYLLWPVEHLDAIVEAWARTQPDLADDVATSIGVLHLPPAPPFPEALRGTAVVHLALSASRGAEGARPLLDAVRAVATPTVDDWGPATAEKLAQIHLDPPVATPALGTSRWLTGDAPAHAADLFGHVRSDDSAVVMLEIRSVGNDAEPRPGADTRIGGPYIAHAVAPLTGPDARADIDDAFAALHASMAPVDAGSTLGTWLDGATTTPDALPDDVRARVTAAADAVDPHGVLVRTKFVR